VHDTGDKLIATAHGLGIEDRRKATQRMVEASRSTIGVVCLGHATYFETIYLYEQHTNISVTAVGSDPQIFSTAHKPHNTDAWPGSQSPTLRPQDFRVRTFLRQQPPLRRSNCASSGAAHLGTLTRARLADLTLLETAKIWGNCLPKSHGGHCSQRHFACVAKVVRPLQRSFLAQSKCPGACLSLTTQPHHKCLPNICSYPHTSPPTFHLCIVAY
jgi:hypothetical protein